MDRIKNFKINKIVFIMLLILSTQSLFAKENKLIGIWQENSKKISSAWGNVYRFFEDGTFVYNTSQYTNLQRIVSVNGNYKINGDTLFTQVLFIVERKGGIPYRPDIIGETEWFFKNSTLDTCYYSNLEFEPSSLKIFQKTKTQIIEIDGTKYYLVEKDPNKYE